MEYLSIRTLFTIDNTDSTKRVRAMANSISCVEPEFSSQALVKISEFFNRIRPDDKMDKVTTSLFELTRRILVEKTSFKVGPDFYRFISMKFDAELFPELKIV